jgi:hypothetical protein
MKMSVSYRLRPFYLRAKNHRYPNCWKDNIKMDLSEIGCEGVDWILLDNSVQWLAFWTWCWSLWVPILLYTSWATINLLRNTLDLLKDWVDDYETCIMLLYWCMWKRPTHHWFIPVAWKLPDNIFTPLRGNDVYRMTHGSEHILIGESLQDINAASLLRYQMALTLVWVLQRLVWWLELLINPNKNAQLRP